MFSNPFTLVDFGMKLPPRHDTPYLSVDNKALAVRSFEARFNIENQIIVVSVNGVPDDYALPGNDGNNI